MLLLRLLWDMSDIDVGHLFSTCDSNSKGYLNEDDLRRICPQLSATDIAFIFAQLDTDGSGTIEKDEFLNGFEDAVLKGEHSGLGGMQRRASIVEEKKNLMPAPSIRKSSSSKFKFQEEEVFDSDHDSVLRPTRLIEPELYHSESDTAASVDFSLPCQDDVILLYEQLQNSGMTQLMKKFEKVVGSFYKEIREKKTENERLQHVYESEREMYNRRMEEVEIEIDSQLQLAERKARAEERDRLTREKEEMRANLEEEMREMKDNIDRLQKMEKVLEREGEKLSHQKELQAKLREMSRENIDLRRGMAENHLELAMIKSELAQVKSEYDHKQDEFERHRDEVHNSVEDSESIQKQLILMFEANKKLHDTNENLRDALDSRASMLRQFNLRTPSPSVFNRDSSFSPLQQSAAIEGRRLFSPNQHITDDELDSGLTMHMDDYMTDSAKPKGDKIDEPLVGYNMANGPAERTFRVVMCGDAAVGKSSLVMRLVKGQYTNQLPSTLGVDFHVKTVNIDSRNVALQLWDTAGQERFRSLCKSYFRRADGAILVYDVMSEKSFLRVRDWIDTIKESVERSIPVILVGNKCDLRMEGDPGAVPTRDGAAMAAAMGILFTEASALDGKNVENAMLKLARELMAVEDVEIRSTGVVLSPKAKQKTGCFSRCKS